MEDVPRNLCLIEVLSLERWAERPEDCFSDGLQFTMTPLVQ